MIEAKRILRKEMRDLRRACAERSFLDQTIAEYFLKSEIYAKADTLLIYASFDAETDTHALIDKALSDRKKVFLPRCVPGTNELRFFGIDSVEDLQADAFGIPAPSENEERLFTEENNAVCIVPGLAFSKQGDRLGYGRGYYDTFLEKINVCTVGLCYNFQVVDTIPTEPHDKRMQYLCTDRGLIPCASGNAF